MQDTPCTGCKLVAGKPTQTQGEHANSTQKETYRPVSKTCTVTGPTVMDIHGQVNSIQDRCAYSLVSTPLVPDFHVLANFQERRRKDVSFLDSVTLRLDGPGVYIHLEQGGRLNDSTLTLNSSAQMVHGVELSKDQTGVTAKLSLNNLFTSVFFDGYTAQIYLEEPAISSLEGLCGNSSRSLSELRLSEYSSTSCEIQYDDTADSTINCNNVTERHPGVECLLGASWLKCSRHFQSLGGPRADPGYTGEVICLGWPGKAPVSPQMSWRKWLGEGGLGDPTVCRENSASLTLVGCLLEDKGIDYSALHLNDPTCRGQMDELTHMVTFNFNSSNSCGTVIMTNNKQVINRNTIMTLNRSSDVITRHDQVYIDFSCVQAQPDVKTSTFKISDSSVIQHITSGTWNYTLTMKAFTDSSRTQAVESSTEVQLNQKIWVELKTGGLDKDKVVVTDSCWATDQASPTSSPTYNLIINGCANPADPTVEVEKNGVGTSTYFSFNMFEFTGSSGNVYLHCKLRLCPKQEHNCIPTCNGAAHIRRSPRATYEGEALISMAWTH
uniref:ZP domain-containing protein n=1 Tax=Amphilophus citrinellus TaxID=61819 RepID=A0A3Q0RF97_AMPCI